MAHLDAKPGDYYYIKMKGYPKWPGIVASEDMLPEIITSKRPVSAARPDGSYRDDFQDGGKRVLDRTFPCMFLGTNELYVFLAISTITHTNFQQLLGRQH